MRESRAQVVLLVRAFEEADTGGLLLSEETRSAATRRAATVTGLVAPGASAAGSFSTEETVYRRARLLWEMLSRRLPTLPRIAGAARNGSGVVPITVVLSLLVGLSTNALGPVRTINLLSFPLLGLLAWNLFVYAGLLTGFVVRLRRPGRNAVDDDREPASRRPVMRVVDLFIRFALWRSLATWKKRGSSTDRVVRVGADALVRFAALWHRSAGRLLAARAHMLLQLAAMLVVLGALAGMYARGLAFEYEVTWESTLLGERQVQALLDLVLGPAAALIGTHVPEVGPLQQEPGAAAIWFHLYAVTALLVVGLPRSLLTIWFAWIARRRSRSVPVDLRDPYFRRMLTQWRGAHRRVVVQPYSLTCAAPTLDVLRSMLHDFYGARAEVTLAAPLSYGDGLPDGAPLQVSTSGERVELIRIVVFNLAQSPESEVHGRVVAELKRRTAEDEGRLVVILDTSSYRDQGAERRAERLRAWKRVLQETEIHPLVLDLEKPPEDRWLRQLRTAEWPDEEGEAATWQQ